MVFKMFQHHYYVLILHKWLIKKMNSYEIIPVATVGTREML